LYFFYFPPPSQWVPKDEVSGVFETISLALLLAISSLAWSRLESSYELEHQSPNQTQRLVGRRVSDDSPGAMKLYPQASTQLLMDFYSLNF
jgi:hypothetical protein